MSSGSSEVAARKQNCHQHHILQSTSRHSKSAGEKDRGPGPLAYLSQGGLSRGRTPRIYTKFPYLRLLFCWFVCTQVYIFPSPIAHSPSVFCPLETISKLQKTFFYVQCLFEYVIAKMCNFVHAF